VQLVPLDSVFAGQEQQQRNRIWTHGRRCCSCSASVRCRSHTRRRSRRHFAHRLVDLRVGVLRRQTPAIAVLAVVAFLHGVRRPCLQQRRGASPPPQVTVEGTRTGREGVQIRTGMQLKDSGDERGGSENRRERGPQR
jgi:hypothetical protein